MRAGLSLDVHPSGKQVAVGDAGGVVRVGDLETAQTLHAAAAHEKPVRGLSYLPADPSLLLSASDDGSVALLDAQHAAAPVASFEHRTASHQPSPVLAVAAHPSAHSFATAAADGSVRVWDLSTRKCLHAFHAAHSGPAWSLAYNPQGTRLVSVGADSELVLYAVA